MFVKVSMDHIKKFDKVCFLIFHLMTEATRKAANRKIWKDIGRSKTVHLRPNGYGPIIHRNSLSSARRLHLEAVYNTSNQIVSLSKDFSFRWVVLFSETLCRTEALPWMQNIKLRRRKFCDAFLLPRNLQILPYKTFFKYQT